jgi:hypothetical protein
MPQYSSTRDGAGFTINTTYNSETETVTTVVTAPNGSTATTTTQRFVSEGGATAAFPDLLAQLQASGALPAGSVPPGSRVIYNAVSATTTGAIQQADKAEVAARATGTPVAQNPAPPPSTNNQVNPAVAPAPNNTPLVESSSPPAAIPISSDPAQQQQENRNIVETIRFDGGVTTVSPVNDPSQRAQAQQDAIDAEAPAVISTFEDPAQRGAAFREAIENPGPVSPSDIVDPAQRQQNVIIESEVPATISTFQDPSQRGQAQQEEIQNSAPAANPMGQDPAQRAQAAETIKSENPNQSGAESNRLALRNAQAGQTEQTSQKFKAQEDWRVRLSLAPGANYLYKVGQGAAGILNPLQATDGVIFPYTPSISVAYSAGYDSTDVTHSNYKFFSYKNSSVDNVTITADFTAQDTAEAQYLLAVIHFFRSVTKMFYGKDPGPGPGVPPPLCYLNGLGSFQFDWHPLVINNFTYTLPTDVDYIRAMDTASRPGVNIGSGQSKGKSGEDPTMQRMAGGGIQSGALAAPPQFKNDSGNKDAVTYVPTKMSITIQAYPIVSRNDVSNNFSLKEYATGKLLRGSQRQSGGFW